MLIFVHGMYFSANEWQPFIKYFTERNFECKAIGLRKGLDKRETNFKDYVNKVKAMVTKDDIVIGHSMGGLIVQKVAEETKIKAGVCICPAPPKGIKLHVVKLSSLRYLPKIITKKPFKPSFPFLKNLLLNCVEEEAKGIYEKLEEEPPIVTYELAINKVNIDENKVNRPLLFIATKDDNASPPELIKNIALKYNAEYKIYDGCHYIFDNWQDIVRGIEGFIVKLYEKK